MQRSTFLRLVLGLAAAAGACLAHADEQLWQQLRQGGLVVLVRHAATTPGTGDPEGMRLQDCATQRNLSDAGRTQARRLGEVLRGQQVPVSAVLSSPWCRCRDTARLAFGREPGVDARLGNLFGRSEREAVQLPGLRRLVQQPVEAGNRVLVSHGSTIVALTGVYPGMGEMVIVRPTGGSGFTVVGRLIP